MEPIRQLKIEFDKEIISNIQTYLMDILNTHDVVYDVEGEIINEIITSPYCKSVHFISERRDKCKCYMWELSKSAIHFKKPFEDQCPGGLTLVSMPVCLDENTVIGAHCAVISNPLRSKFLIYDIANQFGIDAHILWDAVKKTSLIPKPILKIAREQVVIATELMSRVVARIHTLKQSEAAMAKKYRCIEDVFKSTKNE